MPDVTTRPKCPCGCKKTFKPSRPHQRFFDLAHKQKYWREVYAGRRSANDRIAALESRVEAIEVAMKSK